MCSAPKCQMRFTHANRHCPEHPYDQLKRCDGYVVQAVTEQNYEVIKWLEKYKMEKEDRTPTRKTPKRTKISSSSHSDDTSMRITPSHEKSNENYSIATGSDENQFPVTPNNPYKSRKGLMVELDMNAGLGASPLTGTKLKPTPKVIRWHDSLSQEEDSADEFEMAAQSAFNPKKRWLREAWQHDLARPLESLPPNGRCDMMDTAKFCDKQSTPLQHHRLQSSPSKQIANDSVQRENCDKTLTQMNPNQLRPTVLMVASKDRAMPLTSLSTNVPLAVAKNHLDAFHAHSQLQPKSPTSTHNVNCSNLQENKNGNDDKHKHTGPKNVLASTPIVSADQRRNSNDGTNRKWLGALALMELATEENTQVSSLPLVCENSTMN